MFSGKVYYVKARKMCSNQIFNISNFFTYISHLYIFEKSVLSNVIELQETYLHCSLLNSFLRDHFFLRKCFVKYFSKINFWLMYLSIYTGLE